MYYTKEECFEEEEREKDSAGIPDDLNLKLPFLAYGFYKPNQLAYSTIKGYVFNKPKKVMIKNVLNHINGMPVLEREINRFDVEAYIIEFKFGKEKTAYRRIGRTKNKNIYRWDTLMINDEKVNVLLNAGEDSFPIYTSEWDKYDWRNDPIFENTLIYLDKNINRLKDDWDNIDNNFERFIQIQSLYMTLWMALDRFLTFRYGRGKRLNVKLLSREYFFKKALKNNYNALVNHNFFDDEYDNNDWSDTVYSAENLKPYTLDKEKSTCSALYYYTLRNNVVHAGKMLTDEVNMLLNALIGLTDIFREIIEYLQ